MLAAFGAWTATWEHWALCTVLQGRFIYANFFLSLFAFCIGRARPCNGRQSGQKEKTGGRPLYQRSRPSKKVCCRRRSPYLGFRFLSFGPLTCCFTHTVTPRNTKGQIERCGACGPQVPIFEFNVHTRTYMHIMHTQMARSVGAVAFEKRQCCAAGMDVQ